MKRRSVAKLLGLGLIGGAAAVSSDEVSINRDDLIDRDADAAATEIGTRASTPEPDDIDVDKGKIRAPRLRSRTTTNQSTRPSRMGHTSERFMLARPTVSLETGYNSP